MPAELLLAASQHSLAQGLEVCLCSLFKEAISGSISPCKRRANDKRLSHQNPKGCRVSENYSLYSPREVWYHSPIMNYFFFEIGKLALLSLEMSEAAALSGQIDTNGCLLRPL